MKSNVKNKTGNSVKFLKTRTGKRMVFYALICALPVLQFCIFTFYVNFNSIKMAFETYDYARSGDDAIIKSFAGLANFKTAWQAFTDRGYMVLNSFWLFASNIFITIPLALIFSFYLCKKCRFSGFFKVILYMPNIISPMIFAILFQRMVNFAIPDLVEKLTGKEIPQMMAVAQNPDYGIVLFFNVWLSFGVNVLMFTGAMSGINTSVVESAKLDGANVVQEFLRITLPMIFSTVSTFIILGMAGIFTNQMHIYTFFGTNAAGIETIGYFIFVSADVSDYIAPSGYLSYPQLAAFGLILTMIVAPITFAARKLFDKFGPSEN